MKCKTGKSVGSQKSHEIQIGDTTMELTPARCRDAVWPAETWPNQRQHIPSAWRLLYENTKPLFSANIITVLACFISCCAETKNANTYTNICRNPHQMWLPCGQQIPLMLLILKGIKLQHLSKHCLFFIYIDTEESENAQPHQHFTSTQNRNLQIISDYRGEIT